MVQRESHSVTEARTAHRFTQHSSSPLAKNVIPSRIFLGVLFPIRSASQSDALAVAHRRTELSIRGRKRRHPSRPKRTAYGPTSSFKLYGRVPARFIARLFGKDHFLEARLVSTPPMSVRDNRWLRSRSAWATDRSCRHRCRSATSTT